MKKTVYLLITALLFSSCAGGLYSHYPKVKRGPQKTVEQEKPKENNTGHEFSQLNQKKPVLSLAKGNEDIDAPALAPPAKPKQKKPLKRIVTDKTIATVIKSFTKKDKNAPAPPVDDDADKEDNMKANIAIAFAIAGWVLALLSFLLPLLLLMALVAEIVALIFGIIAKKEIDNNPELYSGRANAIAGIVLSAIFLVLFTLLLILAILFLAFLLHVFSW